MPTPLSDSLIITQVLSGRQAAYALLVGRYQQYVLTLVLRYVPQREEAEELAQDIFIKAYRHLSGFRSESKFSTWLYTIVHTTCLSQLRKMPSHLVAVEEDQLAAISGQHNNTEAATVSEQRSRNALLEIAMMQLNPGDSEVLTLFYMASQTLEEIAVIMGSNTTNIKVKLHRARIRLRAILEKSYPAEIPYFYTNS